MASEIFNLSRLSPDELKNYPELEITNINTIFEEIKKIVEEIDNDEIINVNDDFSWFDYLHSIVIIDESYRNKINRLNSWLYALGHYGMNTSKILKKVLKYPFPNEKKKINKILEENYEKDSIGKKSNTNGLIGGQRNTPTYFYFGDKLDKNSITPKEKIEFEKIIDSIITELFLEQIYIPREKQTRSSLNIDEKIFFRRTEELNKRIKRTLPENFFEQNIVKKLIARVIVCKHVIG